MNRSMGDDDRARRVRISDAEREAAMASLGRAFAEGRLTVEEYDERVQDCAAAQTGSDLVPLFRDLPQATRGGATSAGTPGVPDKLYNAHEIDAAYQQGRRTKLGLLGLTSIGSIGAAGVLSLMYPTSIPLVLLLFIPTVWIMLYVMKVGPRQWHMPSPAAVDKQRLRELKNAEKLVAVELRMAEQDKLAKLRMERREQTEELANRALGFMNSKLDPKWLDEKLRGGLGNGRGGSKPGDSGAAADKDRDSDNPYGRQS